MKPRIVFSAIVAAIALVLLSYFLPKSSFSLLKSGIPEYANSAKPIETEVGREFVIVLESNPTTGYGWRLAAGFDKKMMEVVEIRHNATRTKLVGAGGKDLWTFKGLQEGNGTILLEYVRPWEKDIPPVKKESFTVHIRNSKKL